MDTPTTPTKKILLPVIINLEYSYPETHASEMTHVREVIERRIQEEVSGIVAQENEENGLSPNYKDIKVTIN